MARVERLIGRLDYRCLARHIVFINLECGASTNGLFLFAGRELIGWPWTDNEVYQLDGRTRMTL